MTAAIIKQHRAAVKSALSHRSPSGQWQVVSNQFGYPIYSADVPNRPDVEISDIASEAGKFGNLTAAQSMAKSMSWLFGYTFEAVPCAS